jgi:hypothetical protein
MVDHPPLLLMDYHLQQQLHIHSHNAFHYYPLGSYAGRHGGCLHSRHVRMPEPKQHRRRLQFFQPVAALISLWRQRLLSQDIAADCSLLLLRNVNVCVNLPPENLPLGDRLTDIIVLAFQVESRT